MKTISITYRLLTDDEHVKEGDIAIPLYFDVNDSGSWVVHSELWPHPIGRLDIGNRSTHYKRVKIWRMIRKYQEAQLTNSFRKPNDK